MASKPDKSPAGTPGEAGDAGEPPLPTALLLHRTEEGDHFDWLMVDPRTADDPAARLWTARVAIPSSGWRAVGEFEVEVIAPHRREYLQYEGPVSGNRGSVTRVDEGRHRALAWTDDRIETELVMLGFRGRVELTRLENARWMARVAD